MKNPVSIIAIAATLFIASSCNQSKESKQNNDDHTHDDGSVHQNHEADTAILQEEFAAPADTSTLKKEHIHHEKDSHEHPHSH